MTAEPMYKLQIFGSHRPPLQRKPFSAPHDVDHSEDDDPDAIDKMPVQRKHADASRLIRADTARQPEHENDEEHDEACGHVKSVQTDQRVIRCSKEIRGDL